MFRDIIIGTFPQSSTHNFFLNGNSNQMIEFESIHQEIDSVRHNIT